MKVNSIELKDLVKEALEAQLVPMISGSPAIGKSDIVRQVAKDFDLKVIDIRLSQSDPTDLAGFPKLDGKKATYVPIDTFPIEGDPLPINPETNKEYAGWLIFLDEINSGALAVQAAAYKLALDKMVGQHKLHKNVAIVAAGNLMTDKAIVNRMSTAMQSRLAHFELIVDPPIWRKWATANNIDYRIISFIGFKPESLYQFKPDHNGNTYPSPRTWEFLNRIVKKYDKEIPASRIPLMASVIDEAAAREFYAYAQVFENLITIPQIIANPTGIPVPEEPSIKYALSGSIGQHLTKDNAPQLMPFVSRMPIEFQILSLQIGLERNKEILQTQVVKDWVTVNSEELF